MRNYRWKFTKIFTSNLDKNDMLMVALHWEKYFQHICEKYNSIYRVQMPKVTPHGRVIIGTS